MLDDFYTLQIVSFDELILRIGLAFLFGLILGLERDTKNKPIDFRAFIIIGVTTCVIAIMAQELYVEYSTAEDVVSIDLGKIVSGVLTGIGFLGAGAILKVDKDRVIGTATGASIWASGGIGLALGFGYYDLATIVFVFVAGVLLGGGYVMSMFLDKEDKEQGPS